jgi:hypothetical protein
MVFHFKEEAFPLTLTLSGFWFHFLPPFCYTGFFLILLITIFFASLFSPSWMNLSPYFFIFQELKKWVKVLCSVCRIWHRKIILLSLFFYNASSTCPLPNSTTSSIYTTSNKWYLSNFFICSSHYFIFMKWFGDLNSNF